MAGKTIFDAYSREDIDEIIDRAILMIDNKHKDKDILKKLDSGFGEELLSIAKARIQSESESGKFVGDIEYFNLEDLRFSTPEIVASYRAKRLRCNRIVDLCSGIGVQSLALSKTCNSVFAVEIDERKARYSQESFSDIKNIEVICGDVLSDEAIEKVMEIKPDIIFCDPERLASEKERNIDSIKPDLKKLILIYSEITANLCIEIPPQMDFEKLRELGKFEAEYLSLDNKLNRLNLYFGKLRKCEISVVDIASGARLENMKKTKEAKSTNKIMRYLYELSPAIAKAGLIGESTILFKASVLADCEKNKLLLTSENIHNGDVDKLCNKYEVISVVRRLEDAADALKEKGFGKVVLKYSVDPKEYWKERNKIENRLFGKKEATLFIVDRKYVICRKIE